MGGQQIQIQFIEIAVSGSQRSKPDAITMATQYLTSGSEMRKRYTYL